MRGVYTIKVKEITLLGRMNDVNVQIKMEVDYAEGVSGIDVVNEITELWQTGGLLPPVPAAKPAYKSVAQQNGADGRHPEELVPFLNKDGTGVRCPHCEKPIYKKEGISKTGKNEGQKWVKWFCPKARGGCGAWNWKGNREARYD